uniref:Uncharacterized protein n=1 Tax=Anas platyrhynchos TaxID=8839 RepID=A0A8B9ZA97_ANAPL
RIRRLWSARSGITYPRDRGLSSPEHRPSFPNSPAAVVDTIVRSLAAWEPALPRSFRLSFTGSELRRPGDRRFRQSRAAGVRMWTLGSGPARRVC